ncbi:X [Ovine adenovirus 8]|uniref:X n=1 Tax=Ovine adenovirus 8 TaxID=2601527 RepID=A0A5B8MAU1_9ADEN|nr:X [Ovine adenovirus 8] [Ovine adenovirus 8]QDZ17466.1 X [Ovine adenovirus 8] [Ovine adenovirus 8]
MARSGGLTYRLRIPVALNRRRSLARRRRARMTGGRYLLRRRRRGLRGGFLPLLAPIIAAAIGAIPGIASVAIQASQNK